ncbi:MAG: Dna2/Cas4 domain-containing protein [Archaeoglobus sp.]|nr:Dna2/Cas4 domain-containing protein [Archaeoglobus sp.]
MNFYASWVFRCPRWVYFKLKFPQKEIIDPTIKHAGDYGEKIALNFLKRNYTLYPVRKRTISFGKFKITGRPDFRVFGEKGFEIVEVKKVKKVSMLRKPKISWIAQLNLYLKMEGIENGFLLEISRNKIRRTNWRFNRDMFTSSIKFYSKIYEKVIEGEIPESKVGECLNCSFKDLCLRV